MKVSTRLGFASHCSVTRCHHVLRASQWFHSLGQRVNERIKRVRGGPGDIGTICLTSGILERESRADLELVVESREGRNVGEPGERVDDVERLWIDVVCAEASVEVRERGEGRRDLKTITCLQRMHKIGTHPLHRDSIVCSLNSAVVSVEDLSHYQHGLWSR